MGFNSCPRPWLQIETCIRTRCLSKKYKQKNIDEHSSNVEDEDISVVFGRTLVFDTVGMEAGVARGGRGSIRLLVSERWAIPHGGCCSSA